MEDYKVGIDKKFDDDSILVEENGLKCKFHRCITLLAISDLAGSRISETEKDKESIIFNCLTDMTISVKTVLEETMILGLDISPSKSRKDVVASQEIE